MEILILSEWYFVLTTKIFLIGSGISYSKSSIIQNATLKYLGFSDIVYENYDTYDFQDAFEKLSSENVLGANVTIPFKEVAGNYFNTSPINTIYKRDSKLLCSSTDFQGALKAIERKLDLKDFDIFIFGSGGVSKSLETGFRNLGFTPKIVSRSGEINYENYLEHKTKRTLFINCTPLGTLGNFQEDSPANVFTKDDVVFDLVYNPEKTKLLKIAEEIGCQTISGIDMLIFQAIYSLELFLNLDLKFHDVEKVMRKALTSEFKYGKI